jgi:hypothetical protein
MLATSLTCACVSLMEVIRASLAAAVSAAALMCCICLRSHKSKQRGVSTRSTLYIYAHSGQLCHVHGGECCGKVDGIQPEPALMRPALQGCCRKPGCVNMQHRRMLFEANFSLNRQ